MSKKIINSVIIDDNRVIKNKNDKLLDLYNYFDDIGYDNYPKIIDYDENNISSEYIARKTNHEITKGIEFIHTVANLHSKTVRYIDVSKNKYKKINDMISSNIEYLKEYYDKQIHAIEDTVYMSPSEYLFARNYSIIISSLKYASNTLKSWFKLVENKTTERVCIVHNNLSLDHFIKGDKNYLISYDNYLVDTPILDLYKFYKKEGYKLNFVYLLKEYNNSFNLLEEEKLLFNILISLPPKIEFISDEYMNSIDVKNTFNYMYNSIRVINENK